MTEQITPRRKAMYESILQACKASGVYLSGELVLGLAFKNEQELEAICKKLYIKVD